ncbi:hypothetical protein P3X46_020464 [Hevea brasiliensis]|uniref:Uncharacterized protein n=1 Tax=Hevea brasiliensis TaxID=3981 RepID=A0ABQ9LLZ1_HEVBR|nr:probable terpene synthase 13 [Hevea brasiliensis]KAJ9168992.1 hypothetical protein P3X46_020464 [Hevea brasiliensis]
MAFSSKATFISSPIPFPQNRTPKCFNQIDFKTAIAPENWSITQENTLPSTSSNHLVYLADEQPCIIKDDFHIKNHHKKLKALKHMLSKEREDAFEGLAMVDAIQRLGIEYHFQEEIDSILERHHMIHSTYNYNDLHEAALRFRLLRQEGYYVLAGVFDNFKDREGKFKENLNYDIKGLLGLYEASQLTIGGEDILDEAGDYSYRLLNSWATQLDYNQARAIKDTLDYPHHKSLARFTAKHFIRDFQGGNVWMNELQQLAKLDFMKIQSQYQQEILQISRWWKDLGLSKELKFARNQPLKWYIWSMATLIDPSWSEQRIDLTKPISFIYLIDDIFDVHGTLDGLISFTEVIKRWDIAAAEQLPDYMKTCFKALDNVTNEISYKVYKQHGWSPVDSLRKTWASLCDAFLVEARWFASGHLPSAEEYLENGIVSSGVHVVLVHIFFLLGHGLTKEAVELVDSNPAIISSSAKILRLWDDLGSAKDEGQDGHDGSYVECYMKEYKGCTVENARKQVTHMISDAWKQLNQECLFQKSFSSTFTKACLNLARMVPLMYNYDDNQRLPVLEHHVKSLFTESASL